MELNQKLDQKLNITVIVVKTSAYYQMLILHKNAEIYCSVEILTKWNYTNFLPFFFFILIENTKSHSEENILAFTYRVTWRGSLLACANDGVKIKPHHLTK